MQCFLFLKHLLFIFTKPKKHTSHLGATNEWTCFPLKTHNLVSHFWLVTLGLRPHRWDKVSALEITVLMKKQSQGITWKRAAQGCPPEGGHWRWNWVLRDERELARWQRVRVTHQAEARAGRSPERQEKVHPAEVVQAGSIASVCSAMWGSQESE